MNKKKLCVGIIFGGISTEREISLQSAKNIINAIDKDRFNVVPIEIDKQGRWYVSNIKKYPVSIIDLVNTTANNIPKINVTVIPGINNKQLIDVNNAQPLTNIDVMFPIVHGSLGEDGSLQGMLQITNFPFIGSNVKSSASCMDKDITKRLLRDAGFLVAPFFTLTRENCRKFTFSEISVDLGLPFFVKPANQGSSIGISKVITEKQFSDALCLAFKFDHKVIIERNIKGREIECAILGNTNPRASTCGEIILQNGFYSYNAKYIDYNRAQIIIPAILDPVINDKIRSISIEAYKVLECCGMARVDVFLTSKNEIVINEINTLPGFTNISIYPKLWQASGISYSNLITYLIELALEDYVISSTLKTYLEN